MNVHSPPRLLYTICHFLLNDTRISSIPSLQWEGKKIIVMWNILLPFSWIDTLVNVVSVMSWIKSNHTSPERKAATVDVSDITVFLFHVDILYRLQCYPTLCNDTRVPWETQELWSSAGEHCWCSNQTCRPHRGQGNSEIRSVVFSCRVSQPHS